MAAPVEVIEKSLAANTAERQALTFGGRAAAYLELTKPRITLMVVLTALAGFCLGSKGSVNFLEFLHTAIGLTLLSSGISTLNQYLERNSDGLMRRTQNRPLPAGKLSAAAAAWFGGLTSLAGLAYLTFMLNPLSGLWGFAALFSYVFVYTPLKRRTTVCTFIGAFPGALPPLIGWTAASNEMGVGAFVVFGILFLWQFPHFHAIAMLYADDYARADIKMLPVVERDWRRTAREIIAYAAVLLPVSLLPTVIGISGKIYFVGALLLGAYFFYVSVKTAQAKTKAQSRTLLKASVLYLPLLYILMVLNS
jgi:protoheme IX farnesyltransferase